MEVFLQFGIPGGPEMIVILLIVVLLFGANKIPELARSSGEAIGEFRKGREEIEKELSEAAEEAKQSDTESTTASEPTADETESSSVDSDQKTE